MGSFFAHSGISYSTGVLLDLEDPFENPFEILFIFIPPRLLLYFTLKNCTVTHSGVDDRAKFNMETPRKFIRTISCLDKLLIRINRLLTVIYISVVVGLTFLTTFLYTTRLYPLIVTYFSTPGILVHTLVSSYLIFSVVTNYVSCLLTSPGSPTRGVDAESGATVNTVSDKVAGGQECVRTRSETWRYCTACRTPKPPRVHHCTTCNACYYRLCHHCPALGKCVGRDNYPFFFRFILSAWWGSLFTAGTCVYLRSKGAGVNEVEVEDLLFFMAIGGCAVGVAVGVLGCWHVYLLVTGQTTIEWLENMKLRRGNASVDWGKWGGPFNKGLRLNIKEAFGELQWRWCPWWLVLLIPVRRVIVWDPV